MKTKIDCLLIAGLCLLAGSSPIYAFDETGHRIVAEIADRNIKSHTKAVIAKILGPQVLADAATWPDDIRSNPTWNFSLPWHFLTIEDDQDLKTYKPDKASDVLKILSTLEKFLKDPEKKSIEMKGFPRGSRLPQGAEVSKRDALAFYIHFVGDIHQPLHVGRGGDGGGNFITVDWFDEETSLHKVWDKFLILSTELGYADFATFLDPIAKKNREEWSDSEYIDWAQESKDKRDQCYEFGQAKTRSVVGIRYVREGDGGKKVRQEYVETIPSLSYDYRSKQLPLIRERLAKGGIRLAGKLDEIFASYPAE